MSYKVKQKLAKIQIFLRLVAKWPPHTVEAILEDLMITQPDSAGENLKLLKNSELTFEQRQP